MILTTDYQIILIIITIVSFLISLGLYVYFIYLPIAEAEIKIDRVATSTEDVITLINQRVQSNGGLISQSVEELCNGFQSIICAYNNSADAIKTCPGTKTCVLTTQAYPAFCESILPFNPSCTC